MLSGRMSSGKKPPEKNETRIKKINRGAHTSGDQKAMKEISILILNAIMQPRIVKPVRATQAPGSVLIKSVGFNSKNKSQTSNIEKIKFRSLSAKSRVKK
jgi:hypothetical protein